MFNESTDYSLPSSNFLFDTIKEKKIVEYDPAAGRTIDELTERVNEKLKNGWELWGNIYSVNGYAIQCMVKYEV